MGGLHEFMGWGGAIVTDSGGYQVFSMGHGSVAEEIKRRRQRPRSMIVSIEEEGVRFRSYLDGRERFMGPETSMDVQAGLGSDIALVFDECTPFHVDRDYTARSMERTHRWLDRCLAWHAEHGPASQLVYGIVQGGVYEDLRAESTAYVADSAADGIAIGGSLGQSKDQMREVVGWSLRSLPEEPPRHLLGHRRRGRPRTRGRRGGRQLRLRHADPPGPPRHRAGPRPERALAARPLQGGAPREPRADRHELPVPGLPRAHARLPALPDPRERADRQAAAHAAQPDLHGAADEGDAGGDRRPKTFPALAARVLGGER